MSTKREMMCEPEPWSEDYWRAAEEGRFMIPYCRTTQQYFFPPRELSPHSFDDDWEYREASGRGTVFSYTVMNFSPVSAYEDDVPYVIALVELEEGPRMLTNLLNVDPAEVSVGDPVRVTFEKRDDRALPQFEPRE